jgi:hypothetical protein
MAQILVIADSSGVAAATLHLLQASLSGAHTVRAITSRECPLWLPRMSVEADFFVLELFWRFPAGYQAQGLTIAQRQVKVGKGVLVFSCLGIAKHLEGRHYWDVSATDNLSDRLSALLEGPTVKMQDLLPLENAMLPRLQLPAQHS